MGWTTEELRLDSLPIFLFYMAFRPPAALVQPVKRAPGALHQAREAVELYL
jgi:hypothetical protein